MPPLWLGASFAWCSNSRAGLGIDGVRIDGRAAQLDEPKVAAAIVVERVHEPTRRVVRRERDREEPCLALGEHPGPQVEERLLAPLPVDQKMRETVLLDDHQP
jgi:hypothetical protein